MSVYSELIRSFASRFQEISASIKELIARGREMDENNRVVAITTTIQALEQKQLEAVRTQRYSPLPSTLLIQV